MFVDTPARIAILGAGPIGLEAALYARFLGYDVDVYERGGVAENLLDWGHVRMFTPFGLNRTSLGMAALAAQEVTSLPAKGDFVTGRELLERYLAPLAKTDLLEGHIHERTEVLAVGRRKQWKGERAGDPARRDDDFELLLRTPKKEKVAKADVVIDATGTYSQHNCLGRGGLPAPGELPARRRIEYGLPDIMGIDRSRYAGRRILVVGSGLSAATTIAALAELTQHDSETRVTWVTRSDAADPILRVAGDRLRERDQLAQTANHLARNKSGRLVHWPGTTVRELRWKKDAGEFKVKLGGQHAGKLEVDRVIAQVGGRPNLDLVRELHVATCLATEAPQALATALAAKAGDGLEQSSGAQSLVTTEPDFYVLGAKSYGRNSSFLLSVGFQQIRELFTLIGDRADLDLYSTIGKEFV